MVNRTYTKQSLVYIIKSLRSRLLRVSEQTERAAIETQISEYLALYAAKVAGENS